MPQFTVFIGLLLITLGLGGYWGTGQASVTALIPAFFGLPMGVAGVAAFRQSLRKHAMHAAAVLALLGLIGAASRAVPAIVRGQFSLKTAVYMQLAMAVVCLIFVAACVRSFINARRSSFTS